MTFFRWPATVAALLAATLALPAGAEAAAVADVEAGAAPTEATLQFFNRDIVTFRAALPGVSALDCARRAQTRVGEQLAVPGAHKVALQPNALSTLVQSDGATTFIVTAADADTLAQEPLDVVACKAGAALARAIDETRQTHQTRQARDLDAVARGGTRAAGATAAMAPA